MLNEDAIKALKSINVDEVLEDGRALLLVNNVDECAEAIGLAIAALSREDGVVLGEDICADKLISFGRNADGLFGFTIYHLSEGREYGFIQDEDYEVDGDYFTILFGKKNGANVLRNFIRALREMLSAMERAEGEPRPETSEENGKSET